MPEAVIRSLLFNALFVTVTIACCIFFLPALFAPRPLYVAITHKWVQAVALLEKWILNLKYEVRGAENLPSEGPYIIACKHQSAFETFKLRLIFRDPAIILKKELLSIPLWGAFLKKYDVIAIDRSTPEKALRSIEQGALRMKAHGRPIVIFPQGTRVRTTDTVSDKPYKPGVARVQQATNLPIVPVALNSGFFWPKGAWLIKPGTVVFQIMPPIPPGKDRQELMRELEENIETKSNELIRESNENSVLKRSPVRKSAIVVFIFLALISAYVSWWGIVKARILLEYEKLNALRGAKASAEPLAVTGFPMIIIRRGEETFEAPEGSFSARDIHIRALPLPFAPVQIKTGVISVRNARWREPVIFDSFDASVAPWPWKTVIKRSALRQNGFVASAAGTIDNSRDPPLLDIELQFRGYKDFLKLLVQKGIMDERSALFATAGLAMTDKNGVVTLPVTLRGRTLYAGPFAFAELPP